MTLDEPATSLVASARGLAKAYGSTPVLTDVDLDVRSGVTGLLGSNGSGKTTLIGLLLGLHERDAGDLSVLGHDPASAGPLVRQRIGYSPEHHVLPPDVQAMDLVRHIAQLHGIPRRSATERASDALWQVGLGEERFRPIGTMSTGQRQRVKLATAIAHDPVLAILDEPTDGLDPVQRDDMLDLIGRVGSDFGIDVILSSHLLDEVERTCDHVVILADGKVARSTTLADLGEGAGRLIVEIRGDISAVAQQLSALGFEARIDGSRVFVEAAEDADVSVHDAVRDSVAATGVGLYRMEAQRTSLTDVYLESG